MISLPLGAALIAAQRLALPANPEWVPLAALGGRVLAEDVVARADLPPADSSAMDGWAVRAADLPGRVVVVGESRAGVPWHGTVAGGQAIRISTGALVPDGADTILRTENGSEADGMVTTEASPGLARDIRAGAEDLTSGRPVLRAGTHIMGHRVGAVAAAGHAGAMCRRRTATAVVTTGSELVAPGGDVRDGSIFDSNRHGIRAQLEDAGGDVVMHVTVKDDAQRVHDALRAAVNSADLVVVAGGLSIGRHDHVREALRQLGLRPAFARMAMRPGRPTTLGSIGDCRVLAVPGNPAAAAIAVHLLGRALLGAEAPMTRMPLGVDLTSARHLDEVIRCRDRDGVAQPTANQGSGSVSSLADADVLAWLPWGRTSFPKGTMVAVSRL